ncbi:hypothetical protein [Flavicella sediminum]|uniref:hypothetical protein n=1 Tax=Flavicella sediminum TaxID=2585141 RepID=UPI00112168B2|nr:hypothetical protein [Flavicella sediminum]
MITANKPVLEPETIIEKNMKPNDNTSANCSSFLAFKLQTNPTGNNIDKTAEKPAGFSKLPVILKK